MIFILIHGSWHNGSVWHKVQLMLEQQGQIVYAPTLTGFESIDRPGGQNVGLYTHIQDIRKIVEDHNLKDVILVGHSYSGLILTGIVELIPERIGKLIYLDAFIPDDNDSLFTLLGGQFEKSTRARLVDAEGKSKTQGAGDVWLIPPGQPQDYGVTDAADVAWLKPRLVYTPVLTFDERVKISNPAAQRIPRAFIRCTEFDFLAPYQDKARSLGWQVCDLPTGHDAMLTMPQELTAVLLQIANQ